MANVSTRICLQWSNYLTKNQMFVNIRYSYNTNSVDQLKTTEDKDTVNEVNWISRKMFLRQELNNSVCLQNIYFLICGSARRAWCLFVVFENGRNSQVGNISNGKRNYQYCAFIFRVWHDKKDVRNVILSNFQLNGQKHWQNFVQRFTS